MKVIDKKAVAVILKEYISYFTLEELELLIEIPPQDFSFTYAFPCYKLSRFQNKAPNVIAQELKNEIILPEFIESIDAAGPYINFTIKSKTVLENIMELESDYGRIREFLEKTVKLRVVIEYPSPNTNKPLHFGHVRNIVLGKSLSNLLQYKKNDVFQVNLYNNRGIHICKSMLAYKKWGNDEKPDKKSDHFVGDFYVLYSNKLNENKDLAKEAQDLLISWEAGDQETLDLWNRMNEWAISGFRETFTKFNIKFDKEYYESDLYLSGKQKIIDGLNRGILENTEDGAVIARLKDKYNLEDKILIRSDGTSIYITQDIFLAYKKKEDFNYDKTIFVVADEQLQHFKWLFALLDMLGFKEDNFHLSYGMIDLPSGKMKSREGTVVDADDVIEEVEKLAFEEVNKRYPALTDGEKQNRAEIISLAAIIFYILKYNNTKGFIFKPDESISFEGETGPYIQYCYARIASIISKSEESIVLNINWDVLSHEKEKFLIKQLVYFPEVIDNAEKTYNINLIPQYLLTLCQAFNSYYTSCMVISEDKELEKARLLLIRCVQIVIKIGLNILGIDTLNQM